MKEKQLTREVMAVQLAQIRSSHEGWVFGDLNRRKEFARAFGWNKPKKQYDYGSAELYEPTWIEIFVELGKLLASRNFTEYEGNISALECRLDDLEKKIRSEIHPNL